MSKGGRDAGSAGGGRRRRRLRASYVWDGAVQADVLVKGRRPITIGPRNDATFLTPDFDLEPKFPLVRPTREGAVVALVPGMAGTLCARGETLDVAELLASDPEPGTTPGDTRYVDVRPGDWGVIHVDGAGNHIVFFHFTEADAKLGRARLRDTELLWPAFAITLASFFLILFPMQMCGDEGPPTGRQLIAEYLVDRPEPEPVTIAASAEAGDEDAESDEAAERAEAAEDDAEASEPADSPPPRSARAPRSPPEEAAPEREVPAEVRRGLLTDESRETMARVADATATDRLDDALDQLDDMEVAGPGQPGDGASTTRGQNPGQSGDGAHGDTVSRGDLDTGEPRQARGGAGGGGEEEEVEVNVRTENPSGDFGGLTAEEINRVVRSRQNAIRACYERQLQRHPNLGGRIVMRWEIGPGGNVTGARVRQSSVNHGPVEDCIVRQVQQMQFPSPRGGQTALVNSFPFIFNQQ